MNKKFATCINCIDGRVQLPAISFIKRSFKVDFVDMVTYPGVDKILSYNPDKTAVVSIKQKVAISVNKHKSKLIVVVGHFDCAANRVSKATHLKQIRRSVENIQRWNFGVSVIGLWIDSSWQVKITDKLLVLEGV